MNLSETDVQHIPERLYLFSTMKSILPMIDNQEAHDNLVDYFKSAGIPFFVVQGRFAGTDELSFLMSGDSVPEEAIALYAKHADQQTYLVLEKHRDGMWKAISTEVRTGIRHQIGYMRSISKELVDQLHVDYTYRPDLDMYWTIWPTDTTLIADFEAEVAYAVEHSFPALVALKAA